MVRGDKAMVVWLEALLSGIRWSLLAFLVVVILLFFEGSGMLSRLTEGHPKIRRAMTVAFWVSLALFIFLLVFWSVNPSIDNTASDIAEIKQVLNEMSNTLKSIQTTLENIQEALE